MAGTVRARVFLFAVAFFAFVFCVPSLALLDLVGGFLPIGSEPASLANNMSDLAYGVVGVVFIAVGFASLVRRPERKVAPLYQIALVVVSLAVAAMACGVKAGVLAAVTLLVPLGVVVALHPMPEAVFRPTPRPSLLLLVVAVTASVPATVYSWKMATAGRADLLPRNSFAFIPSHWSALVALAITTVLVALLSGMRFAGWRISAWCVAVTAFAFGCASIINPIITGSGGRVWGAAAVVWSVAWLSSARRERRPQGQ